MSNLGVHARVRGTTLARLRDRYGDSQAQLAEILGIGRAQVNRAEKGKQTLTVLALVLIAKRYSVTVDDLIDLVRNGEDLGLSDAEVMSLATKPATPAVVSSINPHRFQSGTASGAA